MLNYLKRGCRLIFLFLQHNLKFWKYILVLGLGCLFSFVLLIFIFLYILFLGNKNSCLRQKHTCQEGEEAFGWTERFFFFPVKSKLICLLWPGPPGSVGLTSSVSVVAQNVVMKSLCAQLCWVMSVLTEVYTNVSCSPCLHLCT